MGRCTGFRGAIAGCTLCAVAAAWAAERAVPPEQVVYASASDPRTRLREAQRLRGLQRGALGDPAEFGARVSLSHRQDRRDAAFLRPLAIGDPPAAIPAGWSREGALVTWRDSAGRASPWTLPLVPEAAMRLSDHGQVRLDYVAVPGVPLCEPRLELGLALAARGGAAIRATSTNPATLETLATVETVDAQWRPKDAGYLARRFLGLSPDGDWRYAQDGPRAVLQARMSLPLDGAEAVRIHPAPGLRIEHVNLRVSPRADHRGGAVIEYPALLDKITLPDGTPGVQLDLREALQSRFPAQWDQAVGSRETHRFHLQEIAIFVPGDAAALSRSVPFESITLVGARSDGAPAYALPTTVANDREPRRLAVDAGALVERYGAQWRDAGVRLAPPAGVGACAIELRGAAAAGPYVETLPHFAARLERLAQGWGVRGGDAVAGQVHVPRILAHLPFAALAAQEIDPESATGRKEQPARALVLRTSSGASLRIEGADARALRARDALVLEAPSRPVEIDWPVELSLGERSLLYLSVPEGASKLAAISIEMTLANGRRLQRAIVPNRAQRVVEAEATVRHVRLRIAPAVRGHGFSIGELAFFEVQPVPFADAFAAGFPSSRSIAPPIRVETTGVPPLQSSPGHLSVLARDLAAGAPLRFAMPIEPALQHLRGVRLEYRLPAGFLDDGACPLAVRLEWSTGPSESEICLEKPSGERFIPAASLLPGAAPRGALRAMTWTLRPGRAEALESIDLRISVEGATVASAADELRFAALFHAGTTPAFADRDEAARAAERYTSEPIELAIDPASWRRLVMRGGEIDVRANGLFEVRRIALQPATPDAAARLKRAAERRAAPAAGKHWWAWAAIAAAGALLWVSWLRGAWSPAAWAQRARATASRALRWPRAAADTRAGRLASRVAAVAVLALSLGPGLWLAGRLGLGYRGVMVLAAAVLAAWGAYARLRAAAPAATHTMPPVAGTLAIAAALGAAAWSAGHHGLGIETAWAGLPVLAAAYAALPALWRSQGFAQARAAASAAMQAHRPLASMAGWILAAAVLYALGLRQRAGGVDNAWFALGALAAVLAMRGALLAMRPWLARRLPAAGERLHGDGGRVYFALCLLLIAATAVAAALGREWLAEQLGIAFYYALVIGIVKEAIDRRRRDGGRESVDDAAAASSGG